MYIPVSHNPQMKSMIHESGRIGRMQFEEPTDSGRQHQNLHAVIYSRDGSRGFPRFPETSQIVGPNIFIALKRLFGTRCVQ